MFSNAFRSLGTLLLCILVLCVTRCSGNEPLRSQPPYFTAAVFETHSLRIDPSSNSLFEIIRVNLEMYSRATAVAKKKGADIIVFPEYGIFPLKSRKEMRTILETVPNPEERQWNPCTQGLNSTMLFTLSCMARKYNIVVVANMGDKQPCLHGDDCPKDGVYLYNANVAFGRDGTILSRYRKEHLFLEPAMDLPTEPQTPIFTTDFGTFAMFVCFDSLFKPMAETAQKPFVDAVLLPTEWMDLLPQLAAVVYWQAWATGNNVSLLVANGQYPYQGSAGSGVFSGNLGALKYTYNPDGLSKLVVSRVPRNRYQSAPFPNPEASITVMTKNGTRPFYEDGKDVPDYCLNRATEVVHGKDYTCKQQDTSKFSLKKLTKSKDSLHICNNGMCCCLKYSADLKNESYYFGLLNSTHNVSNKYFFTEEMCFVFRCDDVGAARCSVFPMRSSTVFQSVEISAYFSTKFVYPSAIYSGMRLAPRNQWNYTVEQRDDGSYASYVKYVPDSSSPLLTVGLYGRNYDRDPPYVK